MISFSNFISVYITIDIFTVVKYPTKFLFRKNLKKAQLYLNEYHLNKRKTLFKISFRVEFVILNFQFSPLSCCDHF